MSGFIFNYEVKWLYLYNFKVSEYAKYNLCNFERAKGIFQNKYDYYKKWIKKT